MHLASFSSSLFIGSVLGGAMALHTPAQTPKFFFDFSNYGQQATAIRLEEPASLQVSAELQGDVLLARQRYVAALDAYRQAPMNSAAIWNKMGIANHHLFNLKEAQKDYEKAIRLNPAYAEAWNNLGAVYYGQKTYHDAERAYKKAIKLNPRSATFYSNLGTTYLAQGNYKKGAAAYRTALLLDPNAFNGDPTAKIVEAGPTREMATLNYLLAKTYAEAGRKVEALLYLRKAMNEGYADRKKILEEKEFSILRGMPEFQLMIAEK